MIVDTAYTGSALELSDIADSVQWRQTDCSETKWGERDEKSGGTQEYGGDYITTLS